MFAIGSRVADKVAVYESGSMVTGTVVGIDALWFDGTEWQSEVIVEWDAASWSEYRKPEVRHSDELADLLAV